MTVPPVVSILILSVLSAGQAFGQTSQAAQSPSELKRLSLEELQELEVTSVSRRPERLSESASAIQVITSEDIRRAGATSLPEALRLASNLQVAQIDSRQWAISARGFNSSSGNKLLVLIDGRVVYSPLHSGVFWDAQDTLLDDIDRIEVISGPGGTLWGANAINGVINISTKSAKDTQGTLVTGGGGTELRGFAGLRYGGTIGDAVRFRAYGKYFDRGTSALPNGYQATDDWHAGQGGVRFDWETSAANRFTLQGDLYDSRIAQPGASDIDISGGNVLGRWSRTLANASDVSLQLYYDRTHRNMPGTFAEDLDTYDADFQHRLRVLGRHEVVWGLNYRVSNDGVGNTAALAFLPAQTSRQLFSGFIQDQVPLWSDRFRLTLGTKIARNDYTGVEYQPSGRLAWILNPRHMLWGAVSRAVRTPSRIDRELFAPATPPFLIEGGPDFVSENVVAYELGYRSQPNDRLSFAVATFYNNYDNIRTVEQRNPPAPLPVFLGNGQTGTSYGAELTADYLVTNWWRLHSGYTGLHVDIVAKPGSTDTSAGSTESHDPQHQVFLRQSLDLPAQLQFDLGLRYVSQITNQSVPAYGELDARLAWRPLPALEWAIVGQNLLHRQHAEFGAATSRKELKRGVYGTLTWRF